MDEIPGMKLAKTGFQVIGAAGCMIAFFNSMAGLSVAAASIFFLVVLDMIAKPSTFLKTSLFNIIAFIFIFIYISVCSTNQEYIRLKSMPDPWEQNNIILSGAVALHLVLMVAAPSVTSCSMALIVVFVAMQVVVAKFFRTEGYS
jgi:hypothetical protein